MFSVPRYRFSWENLSAPLLAELCDSLGLKDDKSADALRTTYGARPKPEFVRDAWPVLRDRWLADDAVSRAHVLAQLRSARLGSSDTPVGTKAEQMTYLRSCHNQQSLRDIVLAQLLSVGEVAAAPTASDESRAAESPHVKAPAPIAPDSDIGPKVVEDLFKALQIDAEWSTTEPRGFEWWAYRLRQRVWADPARESLGDSVVCVHVETDYIKGVRERSSTYECLSGLNALAGLSAYVFDPAQGVIRARSTAYVYAGNRWLERLVKAAAAFQDAEAHATAQKIPQILGEGEPEVTNHPASGSRPQLDDMLHIEENLPRRHEPSPFTNAFKSVLGMQPRPWLFATGGGAGLTAELAFTGNLTAAEIVSFGKEYEDRSVETALLVASGAETNPRLGNGLLLRLTLPLKVDAETAARLANDLNLAETKGWTGAHFLGAWCTKGPALWFVSFAPNLVATGMTASEHAILVFNLIMSMCVRTRWAKAFLAERGVLGNVPSAGGGATTVPFASTPGGAVLLDQSLQAVGASRKVEAEQVLATIWAQLHSERG